MKRYGLTFLKYVGYIFLTAKCILIWILGKQSHHEMISNLIKCKLSVTFFCLPFVLLMTMHLRASAVQYFFSHAVKKIHLILTSSKKILI